MAAYKKRGMKPEPVAQDDDDEEDDDDEGDEDE